MVNEERLIEKYPDGQYPELEEYTFRGNWDEFWAMYIEDKEILCFDCVGGEPECDYYEMDYYKEK